MSEDNEIENEERDEGLPSLRTMYFQELTRLREKTGLTLQQVGDSTNYDASYLFRLESGERFGSHDVAQALDRFYGTGNLLGSLWQHAKQEKQLGLYTGFMDVEAEAGSVQQFVAGYIPGLLQTESYANALLSTDLWASAEVVAKRVRERLGRQSRVFGTSNLLAYRVLIDEGALRRKLRDPQAWAEQLERLLQAADLQHVGLHVVPIEAGPHIMLGGSTTLLWLPSGRNIAYLEGSTSGQLIEDAEAAEELRLAYDQFRDYALSPKKSRDLIESVLEDHASCSSLPLT